MSIINILVGIVFISCVFALKPLSDDIDVEVSSGTGLSVHSYIVANKYSINLITQSHGEVSSIHLYSCIYILFISTILFNYFILLNYIHFYYFILFHLFLHYVIIYMYLCYLVLPHFFPLFSTFLLFLHLLTFVIYIYINTCIKYISRI